MTARLLMTFGFNVRVVVGMMMGLLGAIFVLQNFAAISIGDVQFFWPMVVLGFGLSRALERTSRVEGVVLLVVGGVVQLSNLGLFALPSLEPMRYWPLIVAAVGLWATAASQGDEGKIEGLAIACLGAWLQFSYFGVVHISSYRLWPLVLVAVGAMVARRGIAERGSG